MFSTYTILYVHTGEILPDESLFTYPAGLGPGNFSHPYHIPAFLDEVVANASPEVLAACGNNTECIFDASETGDISIGLETMATNDINTNDQEQASKLFSYISILWFLSIRAYPDKISYSSILWFLSTYMLTRIATQVKKNWHGVFNLTSGKDDGCFNTIENIQYDFYVSRLMCVHGLM